MGTGQQQWKLNEWLVPRGSCAPLSRQEANLRTNAGSTNADDMTIRLVEIVSAVLATTQKVRMWHSSITMAPAVIAADQCATDDKWRGQTRYLVPPRCQRHSYIQLASSMPLRAQWQTTETWHKAFAMDSVLEKTLGTAASPEMMERVCHHLSSSRTRTGA